MVHRMLALGITDTSLLAQVAEISRWNAWNIRRKRLAVATLSEAR